MSAHPIPQDPPEDSPSHGSSSRSDVSSQLVARARLALAKRQAENIFEKWKQAGPQAE